MDIYEQKSKWKWYLAIAGAVILLLTIGFTTYLSRQLADEERKKIDLWRLSVQSSVKQQEAAERGEFCECENCDYTLQNAVSTNNTTIPVILYDPELDSIIAARNFGEERDFDLVFLH